MSAPFHVLFIEDNPGDARLVQEELGASGSKTPVQLEWVDRLEKGLERLGMNHIQAVLIDLHLPGSAGLESLECVLARAPHVPVIVMTGQTDEVLAMRAVQAGAQDYLVKGQVDGRLLMRSIQYAIQRKQTEMQLADALAYTERILTSSPVGILTYKLTGECMSANAYVAQMVGATVEQLLNQNFHRIESWRHSGLYALAQKAIAGKELAAADIHIITSFGKDVWVRAQFVTFQSGGEERLLLTFGDITERRRAEEALRESEENYRQLFEAESDAIFLIENETGRILQANSAACVLYGYTRDELLAKKNTDLSAEPQQTRQVTIETPVLADQVINIPLRFHRKKDGTVFPVEITGRFFVHQGRPVHIAAIRDITERRQAEAALQTRTEEVRVMTQQLWQTAKLATMGELAASIAHELNNPLSTVSLRAEMLLAQFPPDDPKARALQIIEDEVKRMSSLVGNLLQFSRRSGRQLSTVDVCEELSNTLELVRYHLRKCNILTALDFSEETPPAQVDRQQLRQVFLNLFTNAADAMPQGGTLTVRTWAGEKPALGRTAPLQSHAITSLGLPVSDLPQVFIEISDTGEGIPPHLLERVWDPFYTTKTGDKGTGLGLAICRRILHEHGGTIEIASDGVPGKGSTVRITLPMVKGEG